MTNQSLLDILLNSSGVSIDSRTIQPGQIFFALPGTQTDGAEYASQALAKGALMAVVPKDCAPVDQKGYYREVDNVLTTMQSLARDYRRHLAIPVLAITGSNGKTTNKNLLAAALETKFKIHYTAGNFNNHIGLPLTILNAPPDTEFLLLEMGTNHFGEIKKLCEIAEPEYGSILNIGKTHLEFLHSVKGVLRAKTEMADYLYKHDGQLFLNLDEESLDPLQDHPVDMIFFDSEHLPQTDYVVHTEQIIGSIVLSLQSESAAKRLTLNSTLWGGHNARNLIHAIAVSSYFGVEMEIIVEALSAYVPQDNRSQIISWKDHKVYLDAYNANPTSMAQAITFFRMAHRTDGILILGDMGELGDTAAKEHEFILEIIDDFEFAQVWLVGELFREAGENRYPDFHYCPDVLSIDENAIIAGKPILIKGSRSMKLERLVEDKNF